MGYYLHAGVIEHVIVTWYAVYIRLEDIMFKVLHIMLFLYALKFLLLCLNVNLLCLTTRTNSRQQDRFKTTRTNA